MHGTAYKDNHLKTLLTADKNQPVYNCRAIYSSIYTKQPSRVENQRMRKSKRTAILLHWLYPFRVIHCIKVRAAFTPNSDFPHDFAS